MKIKKIKSLVSILGISVLTFSGCSSTRHIPVFSGKEKNASIIPSELITQVDTAKASVHLTEFPLASATSPLPLKLRPDDIIRLIILQYPALSHDAIIQRDGMATFPVIGSIKAAGKTLNELKQCIYNSFANKMDTTAIKLHKFDRVKMLVWLHEELTHETVVQKDGNLYFPFLGEIKGEGRTVEDIQAEIKSKLKKFINDPIVSLIPISLNQKDIANPQISVLPIHLKPRRVMVVGEVDIPGILPLEGQMQVVELLSRAKYKNSAALNDVIIIRNAESLTPQYRKLAIKDFITGKNTNQNIFLQDGDILYVSQTPIHKVGVFIDQFFAKTAPVLTWMSGAFQTWSSAWSARYAKDIVRTQTENSRLTIEVNELLKQYYQNEMDNIQ